MTVGCLRPAAPLTGRLVQVEPLAEIHRDDLRAAADRDPHIHRYTGLHAFGFDDWFDRALTSESEVPFAVAVGGRAVGSTRFMHIEPTHRPVEVGWT
jgi:hypothetical protein